MYIGGAIRLFFKPENNGPLILSGTEGLAARQGGVGRVTNDLSICFT